MVIIGVAAFTALGGDKYSGHGSSGGNTRTVKPASYSIRHPTNIIGLADDDYLEYGLGAEMQDIIGFTVKDDNPERGSFQKMTSFRNASRTQSDIDPSHAFNKQINYKEATSSLSVGVVDPLHRAKSSSSIELSSPEGSSRFRAKIQDARYSVSPLTSPSPDRRHG
jgi:hypothetical protein